jgi:DNA-binding response OmpR family regulator
VSVVVAGAPSSVRDEVLRNLHSRNYRVAVVEDVTDAPTATLREPDMVILVARDPADVADVCRALRLRFQNPVLVMHADDTRDANVMVLDAGADDAMVASVSPSEFLARVEVALRYRDALTALASDDVLEVGGLRIDLGAHTAVIDGQSVEFSPNEFHLLAVLARHAGTAIPFDAISAQIWPGEAVIGPRRLRVCVTRLRKLLAGHAGAPVVLAERGVGYTMVLASPQP